jgi:hypothetical protein
MKVYMWESTSWVVKSGDRNERPGRPVQTDPVLVAEGWSPVDGIEGAWCPYAVLNRPVGFEQVFVRRCLQREEP